MIDNHGTEVKAGLMWSAWKDGTAHATNRYKECENMYCPVMNYVEYMWKICGKRIQIHAMS